MAYTILHLENLTELKLRVGGTTTPTLATILGINYPVEESFSVYVWDNASTVSGDDYEIVVPTSRLTSNGRWFRVELSVAPHTHPINQIEDLIDELNSKLETEVDPTIPNHVKNISLTDISNWNTPPSYSDITGKPSTFPPSSHTHPISDVTGLQTALNGKQPVGNYLTSETDPVWTAASSNYRTKVQNDGLYYPLTGNPSNYLTSFTESDPTVPGYSKSLTAFSVIKSSTDSLYYPIGSNPSGYLTSVPAQTWTSITGKPTFATVATSGDYNDLLNKPAIPVINAKVYNNAVARTLNSNYTISSTRESLVSYSVSLSVTNPLLAGSSTASVFLEYSTNAGSTWNTVSQASNNSSVGVAVAVAITNVQTSVISGSIPSNTLVRLRSTTSGTATVTYVSGQEILL